MMQRESLENCLVVVTTVDGGETELAMDTGVGNLNAEASECIVLGRAVRAALLAAKDGETVEVAAYAK